VKQIEVGLTDLVSQSLYFGASSCFVQGAGGNLSFKNDDTLLIKASGTRLKDAASKPIYIELDLANARGAVLVREDLSDLVKPNSSTSGLRPSIETAIHSLLPHTFVTHIHSIGAISRAIDKNLGSYLAEIEDLATCVFVKYSKPGIPLAHEILETLQGADVNPNKPLLVLLGNHGIIAAGTSAEEVKQMLSEVENRWAPSPVSVNTKSMTSEGWSELAPKGTLTPRQIDLLTGGAFTPDQVVFLGTTPFSFSGNESSQSRVLIHQDGTVVADSALSVDAWEIAGSFVQIAAATTQNCEPQYLSNDDMDQLLNWDAEKWRKAQEQ
jgi:rhamnose utilization protein RhaD (predicted bifunctional aldolase and dehydrogenase)